MWDRCGVVEFPDGRVSSVADLCFFNNQALVNGPLCYWSEAGGWLLGCGCASRSSISSGSKW